jgi:hypothetical protein
LWASLFGKPAHPECERLRAEEERKKRDEAQMQEAEAKRKVLQITLQHFERGEFISLNDQAKMLLDPGEICCVMVTGALRADFYRELVGLRAGTLRAGLTGKPRVDGLTPKDAGTLHVTTHRVCFLGASGAKSIPLRKVIQCEVEGDVLHVSVEGRVSASYFIIENRQALQVTAAAIRKLASMAKSKQSPTIMD